MSAPGSDVRVSVVVVNHNYGRFLRAAIDSALAQSYTDTEVVVVDDGSTDDSRSLIEAYGSNVRAVFQDNSGQAAAWNAGLAASTGRAICFLDADDELAATAIERGLPRLQRPGVVKVHWPLLEVDQDGVANGRVAPRAELPRGDLREVVLSEGPHSYATPAASGKLWSRGFLDQVMPFPPDAQRRTAPMSTCPPSLRSTEGSRASRSPWAAIASMARTTGRE